MSLFISFEGPEGSGKSTQVRRLYERLAGEGYSTIRTKEPGGTPISEMIRRILLDLRHGEMDATTETLLFAAARAQHVAELIRPFLAARGIVVCDRFADSTYAYQGYGLGRDLQELRAITQIATGGLVPDVTIYLDIPVDAGLDRKRVAAGRTSAHSPLSRPAQAADSQPPPQEWNRLDARELAFHERVRAGYRELIEAEPDRWLRFDGRLDRDTLADMIWQGLAPYISRVAPIERMQP